MVVDALASYIDYIEYVGPYLIWGWSLSICVISMWRNDIKCKYMFMFILKNLAHKGLVISKWVLATLLLNSKGYSTCVIEKGCTTSLLDCLRTVVGSEKIELNEAWVFCSCSFQTLVSENIFSLLKSLLVSSHQIN